MPARFPVAADLDLRLVRFFTVVAAHRNFSRASIELRIAQPTLSRYIQRLEGQLGARLLERTPQGSRLTAAGDAFLPRALSLLADADRAAAEARAIGASEVVSIGYVGSLIVTPAVADLRAHHPRAEVRTVHLHWSEAAAALLDRRVDALVARAPFPTAGMKITVLYEEPRVLLVPLHHRLSTMPAVTLDDFADEPLIRYPEPAYDAFWRAAPRPDGRPAPDGPLAGQQNDKLESVASGYALALAPALPGNGSVRPDLVAVPVEGIDWCTVVLATRASDESELLAAFVRTARARLVGSTASLSTGDGPRPAEV